MAGRVPATHDFARSQTAETRNRLRGGSWINDARNTRSACRNDTIGFRCAPARTRAGQPPERAPACRATARPAVTRVIDRRRHPLADGVPPAWATEWGQDRHGVHAAFAINGATQRMRWIQPGRFQMGSPPKEPGAWDDEGPRHTVSIQQGFWLADTACTEALWQAVTGTPPDRPRGPGFPVTGVSWHDAKAFIGQANAASPDLRLALPTEAQWEYACRADTETPYNFGNDISKDLVRYDSRAPVPVGSLPANEWGLREMHGNVWEWCEDHWHPSYEGAPDDGSAWLDAHPDGAALRVLRGGSWINVARDVRSAYRYGSDPTDRSGDIGFRCARVQ
jgi:hypothetical protein